MDAIVEHSRKLIEKGSKSFAGAARLFDDDTRASAYMLYAWCRHCDDEIDDQDLGFKRADGSPVPQAERLAQLTEKTRAAIAGCADEPVFQALARVVAKHNIPARHPMELIEGFRMDVDGRHYRTADETLSYCYHVAGVVGVMMAMIMGVRDTPTLNRAADLGIAFQLTNIARDVVPDALEGRVYLPSDWLDEAYYVVHLNEVLDADGQLLTGAQLLSGHGVDIGQIIRGETQLLSDGEQKEVLASSLSYFPADLLVVDWLAAVVYDTPEGATPILELLEYANTQLLEYRRYDEILSGLLKHAYGELERKGGMWASWRMAREAKQLNRLRLDVIELTERTDTAIKFLSDMYYARAYRLAAAKVGANDYRNLVDQKIKTAGELYHFMVNEFREGRAFFMELVIVVILLIELVPILRGK